jgi:hypothetical protein
LQCETGEWLHKAHNTSWERRFTWARYGRKRWGLTACVPVNKRQAAFGSADQTAQNGDALENTMQHTAMRYILTGLLLSAASVALSACGTSPADFGITGPSPGQSLNPPPPTLAQTNPDASSVIPGVQNGANTIAPSILNGPAVPGTFYGSD